MSELGTKSQLRSWLLSKRNLTHSAYVKLPAEEKKTIQAEYKKSKKP
jgi:hypothetical protein